MSEKIKKIDLSRLEITNIDGSKVEIDLSKELAQGIYSTTQKISELSFAMDLFKNPVVELTDENKEAIKSHVEKGFKAFVQVAVNKFIDG